MGAFFEQLESMQATDLAAILLGHGLVDATDIDACSRLRRSAEGRAVPLSGLFANSDSDVALLALGFSRGESGALAVPYARRADL